MTWSAWPVILMAPVIIVLSSADASAIGVSRHKGDLRPLDVWGHTYKRQTNLFRDRDGNGVINLYQKRDRQPKMIRGKNDRKGKPRR